MKKTALYIAFISIFLSACDDSNSTAAQKPAKPTVPSKPTEPTIPTVTAHIKATDIALVSPTMLRFTAPGVTATNASKVTDIKTNFGEASVEQTTGTITFQPYTPSTTNPLGAEIIAAQNDYQFAISYQVENTIYQLDGLALPLYNDKSNKPALRFSKVSKDGTPLSSEDQARPANASDWSCVTDNNSDLMWQVPQAHGTYAFDSTYYWGDRTINHRDSSKAICTLSGNCNTKNLVAEANKKQLCGRSDWRLATRTEWKTLLDKKLFDKDSKHSPINSFYFPYVDSNYGEAYWTDSFTIYPNGHDSKPVANDWQGSNILVGDAHVMWMDADFDSAKAPPRSTNESHFTMLVNGTVIPDIKNNEVPEISAELTQQNIAEGVDENINWQSRFVKYGPLGQTLTQQDSSNWTCTSDQEYKSVLPNTQILWQRISKNEPLKNHVQAVEYAEEINKAALCGQTNWRLPTENELKSLLVESTKSITPDFVIPMSRASYSNTIFNDTVVEDDSYYWTSTIGRYTDTEYSAVAFQEEYADSSDESNTREYRVRLISTTRLQK